MRVTSARKSDPGERGPEVGEMFRAEESNGFFDPETYLSFGREARAHRDRLHELLQARRNEGRTLSAYGAAGRAVILLNYCGLDESMVKYVVDQSPFRAGRFIPGVHIPIVLPEVFHADPTDDCLVTAWNYRPEILRKESAFLAGGGTFIFPLPRTEVVTNGG
jgi:NDP-4-keto-2,6-dideoxyhexose 3-C-methyltransferase